MMMMHWPLPEDTETRILDILILQDKTLFCTFEDNLNKMASFGITFTGRPRLNMAKI